MNLLIIYFVFSYAIIRVYFILVTKQQGIPKVYFVYPSFLNISFHPFNFEKLKSMFYVLF